MSQTNLQEKNQSKPELYQNEITQIDRTKNVGFFMLSHGVFSDPRLRELTGDAFRIYLWMSCQAWRFRDSNGILRAAAAFISKGTGISTATVSRCLQKLLEAKLIRLEKADHKWGNTWFVTNYALSKSGTPELYQNESTQNEISQIDTTVVSKGGNSSIILIDQLPQNDKQIISINKLQETKNSLSASEKPTALQSYLQELKPARKRESETKALEELRKDFQESDIEKCFTQVMKNGIAPGGEPPHSPMAYLASAMSQVLKAVRGHEDKQESKQLTQERTEAQKIAQQEEEHREQEALQARDKAFFETFPTIEAQNQMFARQARALPMLDPNGPIVRNLAIGAWWNAR